MRKGCAQTTLSRSRWTHGNPGAQFHGRLWQDPDIVPSVGAGVYDSSMLLRRHEGRVEAWFLERAPWAAALVAALASLPGLWMPFLSDDWAQIDAVERGPVARTPFGDFRPLYMATLWLDRRIGGLSPSFFHLTNLLWIAATASLVVILARR